MNDLLVDIRNVTYRPDNYTVLKDVSLKIERGENKIIFGPESSGSSWLFDLLLKTGIDFEGDVLFKGRPVKEFDYINRFNHKKDIGYMHGDYGLLSNMSVEQNIALPLEYHSSYTMTEIKKLVDRAIYDLNLDHCKKLRPFDLTRSEILKTAYARAIILDPDLLYIENAFEDHCPLNIKILMDSIKDRAERQDKSTIIISFYPENYIDLSDSYIMFYNGKIVFQGNREDFLNSDNPYLVQYRTNSIQGPMVIL